MLLTGCNAVAEESPQRRLQFGYFPQQKYAGVGDNERVQKVRRTRPIRARRRRKALEDTAKLVQRLFDQRAELLSLSALKVADGRQRVSQIARLRIRGEVE